MSSFAPPLRVVAAPIPDNRTGMHDRPLRFRLGWWLLLLGFLGQLPLGLSVAFGYRGALWGWHRRGVAEALWSAAEVPAEALPLMDQLTAMLGATIACWGLATALVVAIPLRRGERWAWGCVAGSALLWFVVDTGLSAAHGVWVNVGFNLAALVMMGVPLAMIAPEVLRR